MQTVVQNDLNKDVEFWWNNNPFAYGIANTKRDQVGTIPLDRMDLAYFEEIERRFRKHSAGGGQEGNQPILSKLVDYTWLRGKKVLDIAVGSGFSLTAFARAGADVTGIDLTEFGVAHASKNMEVRGLKGRVLKMDAQRLQFPDASFDFVCAWGCLMHMPDTERAIREIHRVLKPGGKFLAYMYNRSSWPFWFNIILVRGILMGGLLKYRFDVTRLTSRYSDGNSTGGNMLTKFYTPKRAAGMFAEAGFSEADCKPWELAYEPSGWPMRIFPVFKFLPAQARAFMAKRWGYGIIVHAKK